MLRVASRNEPLRQIKLIWGLLLITLMFQITAHDKEVWMMIETLIGKKIFFEMERDKSSFHNVELNEIWWWSDALYNIQSLLSYMLICKLNWYCNNFITVKVQI